MRFVALVSLAVLASCVEWTTPRMEQQRLPLATPAVALRTDRLPGAGQILDDGSFRYTIDLAHLCRRSELVKTRVVSVQDKTFSLAGKASLLTGTAALVIGIVIAATGSGEAMPGAKDSSAATGASLIVVSLPLLAVPAYYRYLVRPTHREHVDEEKDLPSSEVDVPCEGFAAAQVLGELEVVTPWGARIRAPIGADGAAQAALDWATTGLDPRAPDIAARLSTGWRVRSTRTDLGDDWVPGIADRDREMKRLQIASAAATGEPPELSVIALTADGGSLVAGQRNTLRLTVENRAGGVARGLVARARSAHKAIDDRVFDFGDVGAGESKTRFIDVEIPGDEPATTLTVVAVFSLSNGKPPPNVTAKLAVTPRLCPPEKLTRAEYEAKLAKLKRLVKDGLLQEEELQRYDAILLGCRK